MKKPTQTEYVVTFELGSLAVGLWESIPKNNLKLRNGKPATPTDVARALLVEWLKREARIG